MKNCIAYAKEALFTQMKKIERVHFPYKPHPQSQVIFETLAVLEIQC